MSALTGVIIKNVKHQFTLKNILMKGLYRTLVLSSRQRANIKLMKISIQRSTS